MKRQFVIGLLAAWGGIAITAQTGKALDTVMVATPRMQQTAAGQGASRSMLERRGVTDLTDAISRFSGVNIRDYGGAGGMKTLSVHSLGAGHTGVVLDGMMVSDSESGQIDLSRFSLEQVDSIALTVGDGADIFTPARNMTAAAALHLCRRVPSADTISVRLTTGSWGLAQTCLDGALTMRNGWSWRAQGEFLRADNLYPFTLTNIKMITRERRTNNAIRRGRGELSLHHGRDFAMRLYYYEVNKQLPGQVVLYNPESNERDRYRNAFASVHWQRAVGQRISLQANARGTWSRERYYDHNKAWAKPDSTRIYDQAEVYASVCGMVNIVEHLDASLAADYCWQQLKSQTLECERPHRHTALETLRLRWHDRHITATAALLMASYVNAVSSGKAAADCHRLSPSASVAYSPTRWLTTKVYYKDAFRPATFNDNYYTRSGSRDVRPERARNLGWGADFVLSSQRIKDVLSLEAYRAWVDDKIVAMPMNAFFWNVVNVGRVAIWGFEARLNGRWQATRWLAVEPALNYTLQQSLNVTDPSSLYYRHQTAYTPLHSGNASLSLFTPWANVAVSWNGMTERWSTNTNLDATHISGHQVWNIAAWHDFAWRHHYFPAVAKSCTIRAELLNIANQQYDIVRLYPMPGRSFKLSVNIGL